MAVLAAQLMNIEPFVIASTPLRIQQLLEQLKSKGISPDGLEIKYEIFRGELSSPQKLALPVIAAIGASYCRNQETLALRPDMPGGSQANSLSGLSPQGF